MFDFRSIVFCYSFLLFVPFSLKKILYPEKYIFKLYNFGPLSLEIKKKKGMQHLTFLLSLINIIQYKMKNNAKNDHQYTRFQRVSRGCISEVNYFQKILLELINYFKIILS